ncbi:hypothetical protein, partial [Streptomyces sp. B188M101]|uniref:hypothetical protein n=1 Tax=Streptomyces sp. B188M101 TaxID=1736042 RepID=UPI0015E17871
DCGTCGDWDRAGSARGSGVGAMLFCGAPTFCGPCGVPEFGGTARGAGALPRTAFDCGPTARIVTVPSAGGRGPASSA